MISEKPLLINIDKSSINRSFKNAYSWGVIGHPIEYQNSAIAGSASMIIVILYNWSRITLVTSETIDSNNFIWFLKIMANWLYSHNYFGYSEVILLLDNYLIHKSSSTTKVLQSFRFTTLFISTYNPDFAPVELWFSLIKRKLSEICKSEYSTITVKQNYAKIYDSLVSISTIIIKRMFKRFCLTIKVVS